MFGVLADATPTILNKYIKHVVDIDTYPYRVAVKNFEYWTNSTIASYIYFLHTYILGIQICKEFYSEHF